MWKVGICRVTVGCSFWKAIFFEREISVVDYLRLAVSSSFLHEVLANLSPNLRMSAMLDNVIVGYVCDAICCTLFSFIRIYAVI